ncbi:MAG: DNA primase DnaG [Candidatus ainarchaeum sp.]|nr:DNA primase DnaG [Candidatus ainarchaeum sp.]MDD5096534.1 DNA primase DnaG [Candidatus ainarchaeum sp.]
MAKTYIDTVKYLIYADVEVDGMVDKPDVVGAIFGQTEGLLGEELDLRDLQKNGRIGRIEVDMHSRSGRTQGQIKVPSSLDMVETCIIAAAVETVERVGPCEARIKISKVEDTRSIKRERLVERSKAILRNLVHTEIPESQEITEMVREEVKAGEIHDWGPDKLAAGPHIERNESIIVVEGRADVVNLLKKDLPNVIAIGGAKVPQSLLKLSREREATAFLDGDRGGDIILRELVNGGVDLDFVARAPTGKEVEELTRKEVMKCLKNKVPFEQEKEATRAVVRDRISPYQSQEDRRKIAMRKAEMDAQYARERSSPTMRGVVREVAAERRAPPGPAAFEKGPEPAPALSEIRGIGSEQAEDVVEGVQKPAAPRPASASPQKVLETEPAAPAGKPINREDLMDELKGLKGTMKARLYGEDYSLMKELPVREVIKSIEEAARIHAIVFDGIITQRLVDLAQSKGAKVLVGDRLGNVNKKPEGIELITRGK